MIQNNNSYKIIGTISSTKTLQNICNNHHLAQNADILEIRIEKHMDRKMIIQYIKELRTKWNILITIRTNQEGGTWVIDDDRYKIFQEFNDVADFFDIELESQLFKKYSRYDFPSKIKIITSYHNYEKTLLKSELNEKINTGIKWQADIIKLALQTNSQKDIQLLKELLIKSKAPLSITAMGKLGKTSRYEFIEWGSLLTYGFLDNCVAPGQLSCKNLVKLIKSRLSSS